MTPNDIADIRTQLRRIADAFKAQQDRDDRATYYRALHETRGT